MSNWALKEKNSGAEQKIAWTFTLMHLLSISIPSFLFHMMFPFNSDILGSLIHSHTHTPLHSFKLLSGHRNILVFQRAEKAWKIQKDKYIIFTVQMVHMHWASCCESSTNELVTLTICECVCVCLCIYADVCACMCVFEMESKLVFGPLLSDNVRGICHTHWHWQSIYNICASFWEKKNIILT